MSSKNFKVLRPANRLDAPGPGRPRRRRQEGPTQNVEGRFDLGVRQRFLQGGAQYLGSIGIAAECLRDRADQALIFLGSLKPDENVPPSRTATVIRCRRSFF